MDRNTIIGFSLIAVLLIGYVSYNQYSQREYQKQRIADSVTYAKMHPLPVVDSSKVQQQQQIAADSALNDSLRKNVAPAYAGVAQTVTLENKKLAIQFSSKGAFPVGANIKAYKTAKQTPLYLFNGAGNTFSAILPINNGSVATSDLYFAPVTRNEPNGDKTIDFTADLGEGKKVDIIYTLPADDYMMQCRIQLTGMAATSIPLNWKVDGLHTEADLNNERTYSQVYYRYKNDNHDYFTINDEKRESLTDGPVKWVGFRKQYFSAVLISDDGFSKANITATNKTKDTTVAASVNSILELPVAVANNPSVALRWYIGPNDYKTLKSYKIGMDEMVPLGFGIMAFVKYVNKWLLIPLFYFLAGFISNYGIIIMLMTLFVRLILSFFTYKSYLSAAKMRVLKPELDALRAQYGDDQQKFGMEQMKLYRSAGVNPLGGCLPMLFQIPILFAMYYMFPSFMEFRQQSFLWAHDLSVYDNILSLPFTIPFYGDHVSLFTLLMTASSLFLALYNRNMTPQDPNNPLMKYMPFVFPIILMGVFNKMAAALTFYYTFSNLLSIAQQFIIQKYFINEKAIHKQIQENKNKPATPSKWTQRLEQIQKAQLEKAKGANKK